MIRFDDGFKPESGLFGQVFFFLQRVEEAAPVVVVTVLDDHESVPRQLPYARLFFFAIPYRDSFFS